MTFEGPQDLETSKNGKNRFIKTMLYLISKAEKFTINRKNSGFSFF